MTEEGRTKVAKQVKADSEKGKISIRGVRKDSKDVFKKLQKDGSPEDLIRDAEGDLQKTTDEYIAKIEKLAYEKNKEIMEI